MAVDRITIHHEGSGAPTDFARGAEGGYSVWIGISRWTLLRSPQQSWGTYGYNHVSMDICLSGNRMQYGVSDTDIELIRQACADYRARGWVVPGDALVVAHRNSPGSSTVCPGDHTMARWGNVVAACNWHAGPPPPPPPPPKRKWMPMLITFGDPVTDASMSIWDDDIGNVRLANGATVYKLDGTQMQSVSFGKLWVFPRDDAHWPTATWQYGGMEPVKDADGRNIGFRQCFQEVATGKPHYREFRVRHI